MTTFLYSKFQLPSGLKMLWEAWRMKPNEGEETQREVEEEVRRWAELCSGGHLYCPSHSRRASTPSLNTEAQQEEAANPEESQNINTDSIETQNETDNTNAPRKSFKVTFREKSWFGKKCVKIFRVFSNAFAMTFLAEWGDRWDVQMLDNFFMSFD